LTADYSQIELRMLAHFSDDPELCRAFAEDQDIHSFVASQIYGVRQADVTPEMRRSAKTVNFGVIYGLSPFGLAARLGIGQEDAEAFIDAYFVKYRGVDAFIQQVLERANRDGCVTTILGRRRRIAGVRPNPGRSLNQSEREAVNTVLQGSAADLIKVAMINLYRRVTREQLQLRMLLQIHDELLFEVPNDELVAMAGTVSDEMTGAMKLKVPLKVDVAAGPNWLDVESVEVGGGRHAVGQ
jgi:DNA polymerase-1